MTKKSQGGILCSEIEVLVKKRVLHVYVIYRAFL